MVRSALRAVPVKDSRPHGQPVVVTPQETDEILANPGMGWQTFHRTSKQDKTLPPLKHAVESGAGWRADCLGDMGGFSKTWCHMRMAYPLSKLTISR